MSLILVCLLLVSLLFGQATTPAKGSPTRTALMDALRPPVQKIVKTNVQFKVDWLKVQGDWAFMKGVPLKANGGRVDYSKTEFKEAMKEGAFDDWVCALFKKKGGKWVVVKHVLGATDVPYATWAKDYGAPVGIFDYHE